MKKTLILAAVSLCIVSSHASAATSVKGYVKKDGTYVAPHYQSKANSTRVDNYSSAPNVNPYTGKKGTVDPYAPKKRKP